MREVKPNPRGRSVITDTSVRLVRGVGPRFELKWSEEIANVERERERA